MSSYPGNNKGLDLKCAIHGEVDLKWNRLIDSVLTRHAVTLTEIRNQRACF